MSCRHFFITGLPRSRTAWLANYLTWGRCFCFHDMFRTLEAPEQLVQVFAQVPAGCTAVGHADPANLFFQDALLRTFPGATWIVIDHDPAHAAAASREAFGTVVDPAVYLKKIAELDDKTPVHHFPFAGLNEHLGRIGGTAAGAEFAMPYARDEQLRRWQVQILPDLLKADIAKVSLKLLQRVEL